MPDFVPLHEPALRLAAFVVTMVVMTCWEGAAPRRLRAAWQADSRFVGNTRAEASEQRVARSLRVIDAFLAEPGLAYSGETSRNR